MVMVLGQVGSWLGVIWGCVSDGYIYIDGIYISVYGICIYQDYIYITHLVVGELTTVMGWSVCVCKHHN